MAYSYEERVARGRRTYVRVVLPEFLTFSFQGESSGTVFFQMYLVVLGVWCVRELAVTARAPLFRSSAAISCHASAGVAPLEPIQQ